MRKSRAAVDTVSEMLWWLMIFHFFSLVLYDFFSPLLNSQVLRQFYLLENDATRFFLTQPLHFYVMFPVTLNQFNSTYLIMM
jgi:hypothetical protein